MPTYGGPQVPHHYAVQQYSSTAGTAAVQQICCTSTAVQSVQLHTPMSAAAVLRYSSTAVQQYSSSTAVQQTAGAQAAWKPSQNEVTNNRGALVTTGHENGTSGYM